jgi:hypothetical protein
MVITRKKPFPRQILSFSAHKFIISTSLTGLLLVLGSEAADSLAGAPDLELADLLHLGLVLLTVVRLAVVLERSLSLGTILDGVVEGVEDGLQSILELGAPVDGTTAGGGGASLVHPVHTVGTDERVERLGGLLDGLVESLAGRVATLTEDLVLSKEHTVDTTHEAATLTVEVRVDLLLEGGLVEVAGADSDTESNSLLLSLTSDVLVDSERGVDTTALTEEGSDGSARALRGTEDDVDVGGNLDLGEVLEDGGETVREVKGLALNELGLNGGPSLGLGGVGEKVHDNGTTGDSLVDIEQVLAGNPAILLGVLPGLSVLSDTDNDVKAVVTEVKTLTVTLRTVTNEGQSVVLEVLKELLLGPVGTLIDVLLVAGKVHGLDTTNLLLDRTSSNRSGNSTSTDSSASSRDESSLLNTGSGSKLAGRATEGLGEVARSHCDDVEGGRALGLRGECLRRRMKRRGKDSTAMARSKVK